MKVEIKGQVKILLCTSRAISSTKIHFIMRNVSWNTSQSPGGVPDGQVNTSSIAAAFYLVVFTFSIAKAYIGKMSYSECNYVSLKYYVWRYCILPAPTLNSTFVIHSMHFSSDAIMIKLIKQNVVVDTVKRFRKIKNK